MTRLRHTIEEFGRMGDEVMVFAPRYGEGPGSYAGAKIKRVHSVPFPPYPQIKLAPPHPGVTRALRGFRPDVVHAVNPTVLGVGGVYLARRRKLPLVISYHTNIAAYAAFYNLNFMSGFAKSVTRLIHNQAHITLCTSETTMDYLLKEGIKRVRVWPQGVDSQRFRPDLGSKRWRGKLTDENPESRLLLYVGRVASEKGIERLKELLEEIPDTRLAIVGDGPARRDLEKVFAGTPTVFTGTLRGRMLSRAYASADVFLFPSTTDTLGMAMIEALASGLPVVAARGGATHEVVADGESGVIYDPNRKDALVESVRQVLEDGEWRESLSRGARAAAEERSWENATATLRGYYEQARRMA
ncbi:MAG: glycosyltransferase family 1 protein [Actinomycetota bacterium]|nr:glycosyltransferase family 1 protein [Actinomycetota bacterium]MDQ3568387.1 glycosyltransferase family 1 protein [Actinomycetota bacterium]